MRNGANHFSHFHTRIAQIAVDGVIGNQEFSKRFMEHELKSHLTKIQEFFFSDLTFTSRQRSNGQWPNQNFELLKPKMVYASLLASESE